jgi:hypothetical protein
MAEALATLAVDIASAAPSASDAALPPRAGHSVDIDVPSPMERAVPIDESWSMFTSRRGVKTTKSHDPHSFITFRQSQLKEQVTFSCSQSSTAELP